MNRSDDTDRFLQDVERLLRDGADDIALTAILDQTLSHCSCVVGTIHRLNPSTGVLDLVVHRGIPDAIMDRVRHVPVGKGMAGLAAARRECVQVCNLQTDESGQAKPGAKLTGMEGSIAVPMLVEGVVRGVLGVAKPTAYEFTAAEKRVLLDVASLVGERLG